MFLFKWAMPAAVACLVFCFAIYYPALSSGYVWDDLIILTRSSAYAGPGGVYASLFQPFSLYAAYYRPLVALSFALVPASMDQAAAIHHAINIVLHALNMSLVFCVAATLVSQTASAADRHKRIATYAGLAALVYGTHPLTMEPVLWISARFDLSMTFFCLLFLLIDTRIENRLHKTWLLAGMCFCAMCSKESAIALLAVLPIYHAFIWLGEASPVSLSRFLYLRWRTYFAALAGVAAYLLLRAFAMTSEAANSGDALTFSGAVIDRILLAGLALVEYAKLVLLPWITTAPIHEYELGKLRTPVNALIALAIIASLLGLAFLVLARRRRWPLVILAFVAILAPVLHFVTFSSTKTLIAERYALASLAVSLSMLAPLASASIANLKFTRYFVVSLGVAGLFVLASWIALARATTGVWRDEPSLWSYAYLRAPQSEMAAGNYVSSLLQSDRLAEAEVVLNELRRTGNTSMATLTNFALLQAVRGNYEAAYGTLRSVDVKTTPGLSKTDLSDYYCSLAQIDRLRQDWKEALKNSDEALSFNPKSTTCREVKAQALFGVGSVTAAIEQLRQLEPTSGPERRARLRELMMKWQQSPR